MVTKYNTKSSQYFKSKFNPLIFLTVCFCTFTLLVGMAPAAGTELEISPFTVNQTQSSVFQIGILQDHLQATIFEARAELESKRTKIEEEPLTGVALYLSYVDEIIETYYPDLDSDIVKAVIYHESRFQPDAKNSKTGVIGLMQVSPKWHTKRAARLGVSLNDPYGNILVGCDILHEQLQGHSMSYALNVFAGGYTYANSYRNSTSPYVKAVNSICARIQSGDILLGGE